MFSLAIFGSSYTRPCLVGDCHIYQRSSIPPSNGTCAFRMYTNIPLSLRQMSVPPFKLTLDYPPSFLPLHSRPLITHIRPININERTIRHPVRRIHNLIRRPKQLALQARCLEPRHERRADGEPGPRIGHVVRAFIRRGAVDVFPHEQSRRLRFAGVGERVAEAGGGEAVVDADVAVERELGAIGRGLHVQGVSLVAEAVKYPVTAVEMASQSLAGAVDEDGGIGAVARGECGDIARERSIVNSAGSQMGWVVGGSEAGK
ncbi:hypothetical protein BDR22DRAFT_852589 [Usnea florida]